MPVAVAIAIRYIIMAAVQLGLWTLLEKYGIPLLNSAIIAIAETFGVSHETAQAIMANKVIRAFEEVGIFTATLKTKMPIKVAELLGFTSKGYAVRVISQEAGLLAEKTAISATAKAATTLAEAETIATAVAKGRGISVGAVGSLFSSFISMIGKISIPLILAANVMDFGNWQGAYQKTFQKIFTALGFPPDSPMPKAKTLSPAVWTRIYSTIETLDPIGIAFPVSNVDKSYSRANLADLIDEVAAHLVLNKEQATYKNVIGIALPLIQLRGKPDTNKMDKLSFNDNYTALTPGQFDNAPKLTTKVFTGIISQGVVGQGLVFTARPDDLIESADELKSAAANNLAPFLATLPGKVVYEVKVVSSIVTKDGFKQTGTVQKIQNGTNKDGTPKYRTVVNKFATLVLYVLTDKGTRTKLTTIVLGPVDSVKLKVAENDLRALELALPALVTTTDIKDMLGVKSPATGEVISIPQTQAVSKTKILDDLAIKLYFRSESVGVGGAITKGLYTLYNGITHKIDDPASLSTFGIDLNAIPYIGEATEENLRSIGAWSQTGGGNMTLGALMLRAQQDAEWNRQRAIIDAGGTVAPPVSKAESSATTLYEYYTAMGKSLPSIAERAKMYQDLGLGQSSFYTATAEQNTKLLNALKGK